MHVYFIVPWNFTSVLNQYTTQGYRVVALAVKILDPLLNWAHIQRMSRDKLELYPELVGLLIMCNPLKKETLSTIRVLCEAKLQTVMVTGDNLQTAIAIAKDCEIISATHHVIQVKARMSEEVGRPNTSHVEVLYINPLIASAETNIQMVCKQYHFSFYDFMYLKVKLIYQGTKRV